MALYDAHIRIEGSDAHDIRPIAVTWSSNSDGDHRPETAELAEIETEAVRRGVAAPFRKLVVGAPALGMHVQVTPLDASFPQLVRLCDPRYVRDMVAACAANGRAADPASASCYSVRFARYRPGRKHVLRYDPLDAPEGGAIFAKLYSGENGGQAFDLAKQIAEWLEQRGERVSSARPLAYVGKDAVVLYPQVRGTLLSERLRRPDQSLAGHLKNTGAALYALHQLPQVVTGPLKLHTFGAKIKAKHVSALLPLVSAKLDVLLDRALELYEQLPPERPTFTYGDFKAEHVWITRNGLTLIDFDSCRLGDPAFDIGKFLADLRFWYTVYDLRGLRQAQEQFLAGYGPNSPAERMVRARLYEAVELGKRTVRRVDMFDRDWAGKTERLIGRAQAVLSDLQLSLGLRGQFRQAKKRVKHEDR